MKRSEMVDYIRDELWALLDELENSTEGQGLYIVESRADSLLGRVERFGMLPPDRTPNRNEFETENDWHCAMEAFHIYGNRFGWEPEND